MAAQMEFCRNAMVCLLIVQIYGNAWSSQLFAVILCSLLRMHYLSLVIILGITM